MILVFLWAYGQMVEEESAVFKEMVLVGWVEIEYHLAKTGLEFAIDFPSQ